MAARGVWEAGRVAIVTGAAMGIGNALCLRLVTDGLRVCAVDLPGAELDQTVAEMVSVAPGGSDAVLGVGIDVGDPD